MRRKERVGNKMERKQLWKVRVKWKYFINPYKTDMKLREKVKLKGPCPF
jgi:hypothetical protein